MKVLVTKEARDEAIELFRLYRRRIGDDRRTALTPVIRMRKATKAELISVVRRWADERGIDVNRLVSRMESAQVIGP